MAVILCLIVLVGITGTIQGQTIPRAQTVLPMSPVSFEKSLSSPAFMFRQAGISDIPLQQQLGIPFPQCVETEAAAMLLQPGNIERMYHARIQGEETKLTQERNRNINLKNSRSRPIDGRDTNGLHLSLQMISWTSKPFNCDRIV